MTIVPSRSADVQRWIAALGAAEASARDSAIARLTLLGERAVPALLRTLEAGSMDARVGALRVLERLRAPRALPGILAHLDSVEGEVAAAAAGAAAAYEAAASVPRLIGALRHPAPAAREAATRALLRLFGAGVEEAMEPLLAAAFDTALEEPLRELARGVVALLPDAERRALQARTRETSAPALRAASIAEDEAWLREAAERGDASLVAPIVRLAATRPALTAACVTAFSAIVAREKLRKTHRAFKAVRAEYPRLFDGLWARARAPRARRAR
jgi:HEAT repeat protein